MISVLIVDDVPDLRLLTRQALGLDPDLAVIGEAGNGADGVRLAVELRPDVILLDLAMPVMDGMEALGHLRKDAPSSKVVVYSGFRQDTLAVEAMERGAVGYVQKGCRPAELVAAVKGASEVARPAIPDPAPTPPLRRSFRSPFGQGDPASDLVLARTAMDGLMDPVVVLHAVRAADGVVTDLRYDYANPAAVLANGRQLHEHLGRSLLDVTAGGLGHELLARFSAMVGTDDQVGFEVTSEEGRTVDVRAVPVGTDVIVVTWRDVTDAKEATRVLSEHAAALAAANERLDQYAEVAAHDMRNPLMVISGFADLLLSEAVGPLAAGQRPLVERIQSSSARLSRLVDDLLAFSKVRKDAMVETDVDLAAAVQDALEGLEGAVAAAGAHVQVGPLPVVRGDRTQLTMVLQNLVANAVKFVAPGTTPRVVVSATPEGQGWRLAVADNGIGVAPADRDTVFGMFTRLQSRDVYEGTGIGLAVTKRIVEAHRGRIWLEGRPGGGTVVTFTLGTEPA